MKRNSSLSDALHILIHMTNAERRMTSAELSKALKTNPVVIRRMMAGLRERGLVDSQNGPGGGWRLGKGADKITIYDVYQALGKPNLFNITNREKNPMCLVEGAVNTKLNETLLRVTDIVLLGFRQITLAALGQEILSTEFVHGEER